MLRPIDLRPDIASFLELSLGFGIAVAAKRKQPKLIQRQRDAGVQMTVRMFLDPVSAIQQGLRLVVTF